MTWLRISINVAVRTADAHQGQCATSGSAAEQDGDAVAPRLQPRKECQRRYCINDTGRGRLDAPDGLFLSASGNQRYEGFIPSGFCVGLAVEEPLPAVPEEDDCDDDCWLPDVEDGCWLPNVFA